MNTTETIDEHCIGCVYYPPNLPVDVYSKNDYQMLQQKSCSFDHQPNDDACSSTRKTSCSLVDLDNMKKAL